VKPGEGGIAIDRWNATETAVKLQQEGLPVVLFGQGYASMSAPAKELERLVLVQRLPPRRPSGSAPPCAGRGGRDRTPPTTSSRQRTSRTSASTGSSRRSWRSGTILELIPLHPDRVVCTQNDDLSLTYVYTRRDGRQVTLKQGEVFHLVGLTLDGVNGVSCITYQRETIGLSLSMQDHGATVFKNGARVSMVLKHPQKIGTEGLAFLKASLEEYRSGGESEGKALILEEGMETSPLAMTAEDAQWIESRQFSRTDICMIFGVPPHMIGDTEKSTSFGTGLEQQTQGFVTFTAEDDLTTWEETIARDLIPDDEPNLYVRFNRSALVKGDIKTRWEAYVKALQWGVYSPNKVLELEDENPRPGGDVWYPPPNTAGADNSNKDNGNEPSDPA
jgi:HK97 family phage portal protein